MEVKLNNTSNKTGKMTREKVYDFGSDLKDCRYYVHEEKYYKGEWITIKKYWRD